MGDSSKISNKLEISNYPVKKSSFESVNMAAYNNVLKATHKLVLDAQRNVVDSFVEFLSKHIEVDDEFAAHVKDFKNNTLKMDKTAIKRRRLTPEEKAKKADEAPKRKPSEYNKFMKSEMAVIRTETPDMESGMVFAEAVRRWQEKKKTAAVAVASSEEPISEPISENEVAAKAKPAKGKSRTPKAAA
jgi:hypothetical protein